MFTQKVKESLEKMFYLCSWLYPEGLLPIMGGFRQMLSSYGALVGLFYEIPNNYPNMLLPKTHENKIKRRRFPL